MQSILITGATGFIGSFLCKALLNSSPEIRIVGIDNMNDYYDRRIKDARLCDIQEIDAQEHFTFLEGDITDLSFLEEIFKKHSFSIVVNLAAQAGVRYSIENPRAYIDSNIVGFFNILESCRKYAVQHLVFASSSSVYGGNTKTPFAESDPVDFPVSLYAATKKADELMAHAYSRLYDIPCTGLRFFTVYGPMGRPDMSYYKFTDKIVKGEPIQVYNMGDMQRDFTYIDDIIGGIKAVINHVPPPCETGARYAIYNIGNSHPITLKHFIETLQTVLIEEGVTSKRAICEFLPMQPGDVYRTFADTTELAHKIGYRPSTPLDHGLHEFAKWYRSFYSIASA